MVWKIITSSAIDHKNGTAIRKFSLREIMAAPCLLLDIHITLSNLGIQGTISSKLNVFSQYGRSGTEVTGSSKKKLKNKNARD